MERVYRVQKVKLAGPGLRSTSPERRRNKKKETTTVQSAWASKE